MTNIAVIDVGKTNAKLALVGAETLTEIAVVTRANRILPGPPWPHFDLDGHWQFFLQHLAKFHRLHGVDAISVTTHGAAAVLLDHAHGLAAPMLDYEHDGPDGMRPAYDGLRSEFEVTGSPRLPAGLNLGAQLYWQFGIQPELRDSVVHIVTYPQYWGMRLTGEIATDVTSLGCHTDLWLPRQGQFSDLTDRLGLCGKIAAARLPAGQLGELRPDLAALTGLRRNTPVAVGIHDSNASLYPYLLDRASPFGVVSTGTWVVAMAFGGGKTALDPDRDTLVNVNALGQPVPSARFMGGREHEMIRSGSSASPDAADRQAVIQSQTMVLPAAVSGSGPFPDGKFGWHGKPANEGQLMVALSWYLAMMTQTCLALIGTHGPVIVEGPFARNPDYLAMLASLHSDGVETAISATGTSIGAAMLCLTDAAAPRVSPVKRPAAADELLHYANAWRDKLRSAAE